MAVIGQERTRKNPQGLTPCGFSYRFGPHRTGIWWSWRDLNPRPKNLHPQYYMLSRVFTFATQLRTDTPLND